jgi:hypothetical protein
MNQASSKMRAIAERLIAYEATGIKSSEPKIPAAFRVCEKLRLLLRSLAGAAGFRSLISRALILAKIEVPWLAALELKADGSLECPKKIAELDQGEIAKGEVVLVAQLLGLLVTFVGEPLTLRLLQDVWPGAPIDEIAASEKNSRKDKE